MRLFVPGRLCLFGEHSDWAGELRAGDPSIAAGACLIAGTDQGIAAHAAAADAFEMVSRLPDGSLRGPFGVPMQMAALRRAATSGDFFSYAAGVAAEIAAQYSPGGVRIEVESMTLPIGRGLSSSAAICVLAARAFNRVHGLQMSLRQEMELAYRGERAAGSQCGRMDQGCAFGKRPVLLHFDGDLFEAEPLSVGAPLSLLIVDLRRRKDTRRILADLNAAFLAAPGPARRALRCALGAQNLELVAGARAALEGGDAPRLGELMGEAQDLFDRAVAPACWGELEAPGLHALLSHPAVRRLTWGGKGVGSQGDGAAQLVCRGAEERAALVRALAGESVDCLPLTIAP